MPPKINSPLFLCLLLCCGLLGTPSFGQKIPTASCSIPVVVTRFNLSSGKVELVKDLRTGDFTAELAGGPALIASASVDDGPKRVAIILDASSAIPADEWKLEAKMAAQLVRHARANDSFYILYVGTDNAAVSALPPKKAEKALKEASSHRPPVTISGERVYDALFAAVGRLDPPQFGDALVLFGHAEDTGSKHSEDQLTALLLRNRLRFYGFGFYYPWAGKLPPGFNLNHPLPKDLRPSGPANLSPATGYWFSFHAIRDLNYPGQMQLFEDFLSDIYAGIAAPYRLVIPGEDLKGKTKLTVSVKNAKNRNVRKRDMHFPQFIFPCPPPPAEN